VFPVATIAPSPTSTIAGASRRARYSSAMVLITIEDFWINFHEIGERATHGVVD
jgi:hypothetical protein